MSSWYFEAPTASTSKLPPPPSFINPGTVVSSKPKSKQASSGPVASAAAPPPKRKSLAALRRQRAWDLALSPAKQVPMQGFMLYMSGGGVQIFSMMMVWMLIKNAVVAAVGVSKAFAPFTGASVPPAGQSPTTRESFAAQQTVYVICQGLLLALGLYKCHSMGLLPTASSDWLAFMEPPAPLHDSLARPVVYADGFRPVV